MSSKDSVIEEQSEEIEDTNDVIIRSELSETPFEELLKLKERLGTKVYKEMIVSKMDNNFNANNTRRNECFKRVNKNRPQEISSKKAPKELREVFVVKKAKDQKRDPRFEEECGQYSHNVFTKTYSFLNDIRDKEINDLKKMLKKTKNEEKRQQLEYLLQRMKNQRTAETQKQEKKLFETNVRNELKGENANKSFVNKPTLKRLELVEKFKQLKKSGKLKKYLEKKRKRNAMRERRKIPAIKPNK